MASERDISPRNTGVRQEDILGKGPLPYFVQQDQDCPAKAVGESILGQMIAHMREKQGVWKAASL